MVHLKKFHLDGDNEGKEASLFVVPVSVKGEKKINNLSKFIHQIQVAHIVY